MENTTKFLLPSPNFDGAKKAAPKSRPHYLTPSGMTLLPREKQPPPMYGPRGATVPAKFLPNENKNKKFAVKQNDPQFCEPCEMELQSMEDFRLHRSQHKRCKIDGCNYNGHPSVMDKHIAALHTSGLFEKYRKLSTPEEIAAWREERRKRYPTVANAILRQKAHEQRQKRGERLEGNKSRFGKREDRNRMKHAEKQDTQRKSEHESQRSATPQDQKRNMKNIQRNNRRKKAKRCNEASNTAAKNEEEVVKKTTTMNASVPSAEIQESQEIEKRFKGTKSMANYKHCKLKKAEVAKNALTGLLGMYGSDDDDESETESEEEDIGNCATNVAGENTNGIQMETKAIEELNNTATATVEEEINGKRMETTKEIQNIISETNSSPITLAPIPTESLCPNVETCFQKDDKQPATTNKTTVRDQSTTKNNDSSDKAPEEAASLDKTSQIPYSGDTPNEATAKNDDSSDEAPEEAASFDKTCDPPNEPTAKNDSSDDAPEEAAISKSSQIPDRATPSEPPRKRAKPDEAVVQNRRRCLQSGLDYRKLRLRKQNTMLEKLLEPDIRHERNVLLQCVRFVCENNFFGIGAPKDNAGNKT